MESLTSLMDVLDGPPEDLAEFLQANVASYDEHRAVLAAILPSHPQWFSKPAPGEPVSHVLVVADRTFEWRTRLPAANQYRAIRLTAFEPVIAFEIDTAEGTTRTNLQELQQLDRPDMTEQERQSAFLALTGRYTPPARRRKAKPFTTRLLGKLQPDACGDLWEAAPVAAPFFDGQTLPVRLMDVSSADAAAIDEALSNFLQLDAQDRSLAAPAVLANCQDFLAQIELDTEADRTMAALTDPDAIWPYVDCRSLDIVKDDGDGAPVLYIVLTCECEWEQEHGLQIVYRNGNQLSRVSEQDGHVVD
jgi:hypothetical protein